MSELQAGMLALVIAARYDSTQVNIGKMVEVLSLESNNEAIGKGESLVGREGNSVETAKFLRSHLLPIKPECDPLDVTHKEELHA